MESAIRTLQKVKNKHKIHLICFTALLLYFILITQYQDMAADIICLTLILIHAIYQMYMLQVCRILIDIAKDKDYSPSELEYLQFAYYKGITTLDHDLRYCWKGCLGSNRLHIGACDWLQRYASRGRNEVGFCDHRAVR